MFLGLADFLPLLFRAHLDVSEAELVLGHNLLRKAILCVLLNELIPYLVEICSPLLMVNYRIELLGSLVLSIHLEWN